ncbi:MAG: Na/Pi symporter [Planctomycetes bacterium]|nr:Na/Pi symporter [Planctomycetota bacterium]
MAILLDKRKLQWLVRLGLVLVMVYFFLAAIQLFGNSVEHFGANAAKNLFSGLENPFAGLAVGILATVLVQSSSVTTSSIVVMVGTGDLQLAHAVPMVMGANIGTSITAVLVSLGHITRKAEFRRAFAGATVHDMFNLLTVAVFFPLELATGYLQHGAEWLVGTLPLAGGEGGFKSPIKTAVKWCAKKIESVFSQGLGLEDGILASALCVVALVLIVGSLIVITKNMRFLMADRIEEWLNRVLRRSGLLGLAIGALITVLVQSSSITTSLLIPMFGAGVLTLEAGFPIMLGANIGTTITAMLAASVTGPAGLTIAVVHLLFNLSGTALFFPFRFMRRIPIRMAEQLADLAIKNRFWVLVYIFGVFVAVPVLGILIWK